MSVPGSMTPGTGNAAADTSASVTAMGRCSRCERWPWEVHCPGAADSVPLGPAAPPAVLQTLLDEGGAQVLDEAGSVIYAA